MDAYHRMKSVFSDSGARGPKVVALGGGHGLYASLSALKILTRNVTAVVTVADDGGSSGRLRKEFGVLPPGDLRMALSALCDDSEWGQTWRDVLQYRFSSSGDLNGHSLGNLLITGLWDLLGDDPVTGLDWVGRLLNTKGRVVPMASVPLQIEADASVRGSRKTIRGQVSVAKSNARIDRIRIIPPNPAVAQEALDAIGDADLIFFGPGSWYTSVIPHLLVPQLRAALTASKAKKILVLNLSDDAETQSMSAADLVRIFRDTAPGVKLDAVLADRGATAHPDRLQNEAQLCNASLYCRNIADPRNPVRHDPLYLAAAYREIAFNFRSCARGGD